MNDENIGTLRALIARTAFLVRVRVSSQRACVDLRAKVFTILRLFCFGVFGVRLELDSDSELDSRLATRKFDILFVL